MSDLEIDPIRRFDSLEDFTNLHISIGGGGFGLVEKCLVNSTKHFIVMKTPLFSSKIPKEMIIESIIQEYNMLVKCSHPAVQMAIGFYHPTNTDEYRLLMPYYQNKSLREKIKTEIFQNDSSIKFIMALGIASGMKYLHNKGISHRDLKPENILIDDDEYPVITDFGLSRENIDDMSTRAGTILYAAPEVFDGSGNYDKKVDVYSYALIVNEIYSGKIPFHKMNEDDIKRAKKGGNIEIDESVPEFLADLLKECLNPNPSFRPDFDEIDQTLRSNFYKLGETIAIAKYINKLDSEMKQKRFFRAPKQILKLPPQNEDYPEDFNDPIDWESFHKAIQPEDNKKIILVMAFGTRQSGKSKFLRTITGNQAYVSGTGLTSTTMGILIDGPYKKREIEENIVERDFKNYFNTSSVEDGTPIYFIDSQGFGDEKLENKPNYRKILERTISILSSISNICISSTSISEKDTDLGDLFKTIRKIQLIQDKAVCQICLLVKGFDKTDRLRTTSLKAFENHHNEFRDQYLDEHQKISSYYLSHCLNIMPICSFKINTLAYLHSVWYDFSHVFTKIQKENLTTKENIISTLMALSDFFLNQDFNKIMKRLDEILKEREEKFNQTLKNLDENKKNILKCCFACCFYIAEDIAYLLEQSFRISFNENDKKELLGLINARSTSISRFLLPYLLGNYDISISDFLQYSITTHSDIAKYMKENSNRFARHIREESDAGKAAIPVIAIVDTAAICCCAIPGIGIAIGGAISCIGNGSFILYKKIQERKRNKLKEEAFNSTIFPFIWDHKISQYKGKNYDISKNDSIGKENEQLIIFCEQQDNDSSLLFRSLTGIYVDFSSSENVSMLFANYKISKDLMPRFKLYGIPHKSKFQDYSVEKIHFLYLKGISQEDLRSFCRAQNKKPIIVSSCLENQKLSIEPDGICLFNLFYISSNSYNLDIVFRQSYSNFVKNPTYKKEMSNKLSINSNNVEFLPINSKDFNFIQNGPVTNALIRYGCRYVLQDKTFEIKKK